MEFKDLPLEVQILAAEALASRILQSSMASPISNTEPALKLAREIREAFTELYSEPQKTCGQDY
ncbi:formyltetrahydrofolate deformylase [Hafnia alvei]|uniref:formyltetrahydrofolate deformylase n=1 Tax=Hafnia alvei TaxID=569 RepID=UPI001412E5A4|nr:formyltetrahydrofolate deformylase [Hafnia alvei]QIP56859.1 formyltetrahydrofolate deformylase [Hafnia alvei]